jgi:hypothetical protein
MSTVLLQYWGTFWSHIQHSIRLFHTFRQTLTFNFALSWLLIKSDSDCGMIEVHPSIFRSGEYTPLHASIVPKLVQVRALPNISNARQVEMEPLTPCWKCIPPFSKMEGFWNKLPLSIHSKFYPFGWMAEMYDSPRQGNQCHCWQCIK